MILDAQNLLSNAQAFTTDAASENTLDTGAAGNDIFAGEPLVLVIQVDVAADNTTGTETYEFQLIESAATNLGTPTVLAKRAIAATALTAGSLHYIPAPPGVKAKRYIGAFFDGSASDTPTITATIFLQPASMIQVNKVYADSITIS